MSELHNTRIGQVFFVAGTMWRRGRGRFYKAHPSAPIMDRCYNQRTKRRHHVSPSAARHRRHLLMSGTIRTYGIALCLFLLVGCASFHPATSPTVNAIQQLQARQVAHAYPSDWDVRGDDHLAQYTKLVTWAEDHDAVIALASLERKQVLGHSSHSFYLGWVILLDIDLPVNNRLYTLLHELGHAFGPHAVTIQEAETIAELIAVQVCDKLGMNVWPQTASYLAAHIDLETQWLVVQRYGARIDEVVKRLVTAAQP